jgi:hypothetical protein
MKHRNMKGNAARAPHTTTTGNRMRGRLGERKENDNGWKKRESKN